MGRPAAPAQKPKTKTKTRRKTKPKPKRKPKKSTTKPTSRSTTTTSTATQQPAPSSSSVANAGKRNTSLVNIIQDPETNQNPPQVPTDAKLPLAPTNTLATVNVLTPPVICSAYTVLWTKKSTRHLKIWDGNGILEVTGRCGIVKNEDGTRIGQMNRLKPHLIVPGLILTAGQVEIQIKEVIEAGSQKVISMKRVYTEPPQRAQRIVPHDPYVHSTQVSVLAMPKPSKEHELVYNTRKFRVNEVTITYCLVKVLRPHQRLGVAFLYGCVTGIKQINRLGAILADETGMGKTLQCITLIWTLLNQGPYGGIPIIKKALIVTPSSATATWEKEFYRWVGRNRIRIFAAHARKQSEFSTASHPVYIISYEMFVRHFAAVSKLKFDLMICDEGHRLRNAVNRAPTLLNELPCKRRIILTSAPVQNYLQDFYYLVDFVNPGCLGSNIEYTNRFINPILASRELNVSEEVKQLGAARSKELDELTSDFVLRRTQRIGAYIPTKTQTVVFCKSSPLQQRLYAAAVETWNNLDPSKKNMNHMTVITILQKICNHPSLIVRDTTQSGDEFPRSLFGIMSTAGGIKLEESGKVKVLLSLLRCVEANEEKVVIVSSYPQTLGMLANLCEVKDYKYDLLDSSITASDRTPILTAFNSPWSKTLVLLLNADVADELHFSGASRLVIFDSDFHSAVDHAMSRIWRNGQKFSAYLYRFITTGTLEEKIYQRSISNTGRSSTVVDPASTSCIRSSEEEVKDLLTYTFDDDCLTHSILNCNCKCDGSVPEIEPVEQETDELLNLTKAIESSRALKMKQLLRWEHHKPPYNAHNIDALLLCDSYSDISFMFRNRNQF